MKISNENLKKYIKGAYQFKQSDDDYLSFYHFNDKQIKYLSFNDFFYIRSKFSSSITLEAISNSTSISFEYKLNQVASFDSLDLYIGEELIQSLFIKDLNKSGKIIFKNLIPGRITIFFPIDCEIQIKNFICNKDFTPIEEKEKILVLGDSITQGYGVSRSSDSYVNVLSRLTNYEFINQGIGGYYFDENILLPLENISFKKIIVALGTNQYQSDDFNERAIAYFQKLNKLYSQLQIIVVTPLFRNNAGSDINLLIKQSNLLVEIASRYKNILIINGFDLFPHESQYYLDGLHPNSTGAKLIAKSLIEKGVL